MKKSDHKHEYIECYIKETRIMGNKPYINWFHGYMCTICFKTKRKKWIWDLHWDESMCKEDKPIVEIRR